MEPEKREVQRFSVNLCIAEINGQKLSGMVKDFSRKGMRVILDIPDINEKEVRIEVQQPEYNESVLVVASVIWKKCFEGKCEIGLRFNNFPVQSKAAFLDYGYKKWLKNKLCR